MADTTPQVNKAASAAEDIPVQQSLATITADSAKNEDTRPSAELRPSALAEASSSFEKPASSAVPITSQTQRPSVEQPPISSDKGKEKATITSGTEPTSEKPTTSSDAAASASIPVKEDSDSNSLSIEPSAPISSSEHPVCNITLLLPTGARHPYKIDERYLAKRSVDVPETTEAGKPDPFSISVYTLKELILREWREEWNDKPASPSSIRLIHFGKLLDDKEQLKKYQFSRESPNVVHMSVRPAEMMEEDEAAKGKSGGREGRAREGSGNCCVIL